MTAVGEVTTAQPTVRNDRWKKFRATARDQASREHAKSIIRSLAPYAWMLTVNFTHRYPDSFLLDMMNRFIRQLNGELFKKRFQRKKECLAGVAVAEVCRDGGNLDGCLHFHFLIKPCSKFDTANGRKRFERLVREILMRLKDSEGRAITKVNGKNRLVVLKRYFGLGCLDTYFTKEHEYRGSEANDFFGLLDFNGTGIAGIKNRWKKDLLRDTTDLYQ